jgi:O-antigen/teichoic acid export membrane protein
MIYLKYIKIKLNLIMKNIFIRNWSFLIISNVCGQLFGILATVRIARILLPEGYGIFNLMQTIAGMSFIIAGLGIRNIIIRECARNKKYSANLFVFSLSLRMVSNLLIGLFIVIYYNLKNTNISIDYIYISIILLFALTFWDLAESIAFGYENMKYSALINIVFSLVWLIFIWIIPRKIFTPIFISFAFSILQSLKGILYLIIGKVKNLFSGKININDWSKWFISSLSFYWLSLLTLVTNQLPILFLSNRSGIDAVGIYNVGYRLINPLQLFILTAITALYPGLSQSSINNPDKFMKIVKNTLLGITIIGSIGVFIVSIFRKEIVLVLFGKNYLNASNSMAYQCWYSLLLSFYSFMGASMGARDKQHWLAALSTICGILALPIVWWGASRGATGLAIALLIAGLINLTYHWIVFQKCLPYKLKNLFLLKNCLFICFIFVLSWIIPKDWFWYFRMAIALLSISVILIFIFKTKYNLKFKTI